VCSGGGNYDAFYMGAHMVLDRVAQASGDLTLHRYAGSSAGGMMSFELALKGERLTLEHHLAYGVLTGRHMNQFSWMPSAAYLQDQHWRTLAAWQTQTYASTLADLDDRVFLATSCLAPLPTLVMIDSYTAAQHQASRAFMATGTMVQNYDGMLCTDGGLLSGERMTPLFQDGQRDQIIIDLMATGFPSHLVWSVRLDDWTELLRYGQDAAIHFLTTGDTGNRDVITRCPAGADVSDHVCVVP
jgi:hypothetical protein